MVSIGSYGMGRAAYTALPYARDVASCAHRKVKI